MKDILIMLGVFAAGAAISANVSIDPEMISSLTDLFLFLLLTFVGMDIANTKIDLKKMSIKDLLLPFIVVAGSVIGGLVANMVLEGVSLKDSLAIVSGFGYYSLSSIILNETSGSYIGVIALTSNIIREILTICFAPLLIRYGGDNSYIASAGATSMDTCLFQLVRYSDGNSVPLSIFSGFILTVLVPILVTFFATTELI